MEQSSLLSWVRLRLWQWLQTWRDRLTVYHRSRWTFTFLILATYALRIAVVGGYHIVSYGLAIYLLNLFLGFLTPKFADLDVEEEDHPVLPVNDKDEFKPFVRKLPEYRFWESFTVGCVLALLCTFSEALNVPVFWPILVVYFLTLFVFTMRRQIAHMAKHNYVPWDSGKKAYK